MGHIGNTVQTAFTSFDKQTITGTGTSVYTLSHNVANEQEIEVFVNNVRQEGGSGKAYTVSGNQITFSENIVSTDEVYVNFTGKAVQTVTHPSDQPLQATTGTFSGAVSGTTGTFTGDVTTSGGVNTTDSIYIGTTTPTWENGSKNINLRSGALWDYGTTQLNLSQNMYFDGAYKHLNTGAISSYEQSNGEHNFNVGGSASAGSTATRTNVLSVKNDSKIRVRNAVKTTSGSQENKQFVQRDVLQGTLLTSWTNILTITPSNTNSIWYRNLIYISASGHHNGIGNGARFDNCFYFDNDNTTLSAGQVTAGTATGNAPNFQVIVSGSNFILQGQVSSNSFNGLYDVTVMCMQGAGGTADFTITRNI